MFFIIDRFEGDYAILLSDDQQLQQILRSDLPDEASEGSVLRYEQGRWQLDAAEYQARRQRIEQKMQRLIRPKHAAD